MRQRKESEKPKEFQHFLKKVDVYPKLQNEFRVQTKTGAKVSILSGLVMIILFLSEFKDYLTVNTVEEMVVDQSISEKLKITFNISFLAINCRDAHMNAMDVAGDLQINMHHDVNKVRLNAMGAAQGEESSAVLGGHASYTPPDGYCGSCHGAPSLGDSKCCNTCESVKEAFMAISWPLDRAENTEQCKNELSSAERDARPGEGCRVFGTMQVNRVAGNFHVALGKTFHRQDRLVHQFQPGEHLKYNSSHIVHSLHFGDVYPGMVNSFRNTKQIATAAGTAFQYFIKVVPTEYQDGDKTVISNQYSTTRQIKTIDLGGPLNALPGTFFIFDISAFMMKLNTTRVPFTHFMSKVCAIVGGMVAIAGFIDSTLYHHRKPRK